ncbi:MAG: hypothetical protein JWQ94_38 [Tardiphaga sp.]|nr:hypothetical protein [Tardiphaga sp.]
MVGADLSAADEARVIATAERIVAIAERAANVAADVEAGPGVQRGSRDVGRGFRIGPSGHFGRHCRHGNSAKRGAGKKKSLREIPHLSWSTNSKQPRYKYG